MPLPPRLWQALEEHGVTEAHLSMLLRLLQVQRNGCWTWHYIRGQLTQCDVRISFASRSAEVQHVEDALLGDEQRPVQHTVPRRARYGRGEP